MKKVEPLQIQNSNPGTAMGAVRESNNNQWWEYDQYFNPLLTSLAHIQYRKLKISLLNVGTNCDNGRQLIAHCYCSL